MILMQISRNSSRPYHKGWFVEVIVIHEEDVVARSFEFLYFWQGIDTGR